ncbi:hypothetical protein HY346_03120 [Candidatus Microgenomates bacterium]|nr:hypothetical protein [Candidatus Microgenomates bacterium]
MDMKPGDMVQPGQTGDNPQDSVQDQTLPSAPPADDAAGLTPPPAQPPVSSDQSAVPAAGALPEDAPAETDLTASQTPPAPVEPASDGASESSEVQPVTPDPAALPADGAQVDAPMAPAVSDTKKETVPEPALTDPTPADDLAAAAQSAVPATEPPAPPTEEPQDPVPPPPATSGDAQPPPADTPPVDDSAPNTSSQPDSTNVSGFSWEASEFVSHQHPALWYVLLGLTTVSLMALLGLLFKEWLGAGVVGLMAVALLVYAHRQPRTLSYIIDEAGVTIGQRFLPYSSFRSFALIPIRQLLTIELDPLKRFMPNITMYVDRNEVDRVMATLTRHLPQEERPAALIDRLAHALKF